MVVAVLVVVVAVVVVVVVEASNAVVIILTGRATVFGLFHYSKRTESGRVFSAAAASDGLSGEEFLGGNCGRA